MMYTLDASGQTTGNNTLDVLWAASAAGTKLRIQNRSVSDIEVVVDKGDGSNPVVILLPAQPGDTGWYTDETWVDPTLAVAVRSKAPGAAFTAVRIS